MKELLHEGNYQFNNDDEARNYEIGVFNGMNLMGAGATGMSRATIDGLDRKETKIARIKEIIR